MIRVLLLSLILVGCSGYKVIKCYNGGNKCEVGTATFKTLEECNKFVKAANQSQPGMTRICIVQESI